MDLCINFFKCYILSYYLFVFYYYVFVFFIIVLTNIDFWKLHDSNA